MFIQDRRKHPTYVKIDILEYLLAISSRFDLILTLEKYSTHVFGRWMLICSGTLGNTIIIAKIADNIKYRSNHFCFTSYW